MAELPQTMSAIRIEGDRGPASALVVTELPVPETRDGEVLIRVMAAALPETVFTVFANVFEDGRLQPGETLMVHGATSGIETTAIQMAKAAGARVIATACGAEKARAALGLGTNA